MPISKVVLDNQSKENVDLDGQFVRVPHGTTAQRPSPAYGGYLRFNTDLGTLEQFNTETNSWQAIDSPPIISSLAHAGSKTAADPAGGETITLTGSNFKSGATVTIGGTSANSVSVVSSSSITFTTPAKTAGDYDVVVTNTNGLAATLQNGLSYNGLPAFTTAAGNVGSVIEDVAMSTITIVAAEPDGGTLAFSVTSGALPTGVSLGSANGQLTGTPNTNVTSDTTFNFTITATDDESQTNSRAFNLIVLRPIYATQIAKSLMFNDGGNDHLTASSSVMNSTTGNGKTFTWSAWVKRGYYDAEQYLFHARSADSQGNFARLEFNASNQLKLRGYSKDYIITNALFRDQTAWMHIVLAVDTDTSGDTNSIRLYVNGEEHTSFATDTNPSTDESLVFGTNVAHFIGVSNYQGSADSSGFDGMMADIHFVDGQQLAPTAFAEDFNGVWVPKSYTGTYGGNGFKLDFANAADIGNDVSGNNNDFTAGGGIAADHVRIDSPTNNFCAFVGNSGFGTGSQTVANGNTYNSIGTSANTQCSHVIASGKWYWETYVTDVGAPYIGITIAGLDGARNFYSGNAIAVNKVGDVFYNQSNSGNEGLNSIGANDIIQVAYDHDAKKIWWGRDNNWYSANASTDSTINVSDVLAGNFAFDVSVMDLARSFNQRPVVPHYGASSGTAAFHLNFGQNPSFNGLVSAGTETDSNGQGLFKYPPPTGFLALCSKNLTDNTNIDIRSNVRPQDNFTSKTYVGNGGTQSINIGFQPDTVLIKAPDATSTWRWYFSTFSDNVSAGASGVKYLTPINDSSLSTGSANNLYEMNSTGFGVHGTGGDTNSNGVNYISYCWKAGGRPTATNSAGAGAVPTSGSVMIDGVASTSALAGTIPATKLTANTKAGFSIVQWEGTGANGTVAHGLTKTPDFVVTKGHDSNLSWYGYTGGTMTADQVIAFNSTAGDFGSVGAFVESSFSNTVIGVGTETPTNHNAETMMALCWHSIEGYSQIGHYFGNGSADGPVIHCSFKPAFVMIKNLNETEQWYIFDDALNTQGNPHDRYLQPSSTGTGGTGNNRFVDFYAGGFKVRGSDRSVNGSPTHRMWYMAFAADPFKYVEGE
tara:strand:- start:840 stop:4139 length:3300 start_codon:yes stop_codon:yes gene_type:complete